MEEIDNTVETTETEPRKERKFAKSLFGLGAGLLATLAAEAFWDWRSRKSTTEVIETTSIETEPTE